MMSPADRVIALAERIDYLERLLDRAYPLLHNPYTQQTDPLLATTYDRVIDEVQTVIQHLREEPDPERVTLPCASCDGTGCQNCAPADTDGKPLPLYQS